MADARVRASSTLYSLVLLKRPRSPDEHTNGHYSSTAYLTYILGASIYSWSNGSHTICAAKRLLGTAHEPGL